MWEGAGAGTRLIAGVIGARYTNLALRFGGEKLERFEIGMWFGSGSWRQTFPRLEEKSGK